MAANSSGAGQYRIRPNTFQNIENISCKPNFISVIEKCDIKNGKNTNKAGFELIAPAWKAWQGPGPPHGQWKISLILVCMLLINYRLLLETDIAMKQLTKKSCGKRTTSNFMCGLLDRLNSAVILTLKAAVSIGCSVAGLAWWETL